MSLLSHQARIKKAKCVFPLRLKLACQYVYLHIQIIFNFLVDYNLKFSISNFTGKKYQDEITKNAQSVDFIMSTLLHHYKAIRYLVNI